MPQGFLKTNSPPHRRCERFEWMSVYQGTMTTGSNQAPPTYFWRTEQ